MKKKIISLLLAAFMVSGMFSGMVYAEASDTIKTESDVFLDMPVNWSADAIVNAVKNGLLTGYSGKIMPSGNLTRAQLAVILNRAFGSEKEASLSDYSDVGAGKWYDSDMAKAVQMKVFVGSGGKLYPNRNITREEAFTVLARAFKLTGAGESSLDVFKDRAALSTWAKEPAASLTDAGYVSGSKGYLNPKRTITRAEFAQLMNNLLAAYYNKAGTYTDDIFGNAMINAPGVILKQLTISGDLIIGDGVGDGDVILDGVTVTGRTVIRGGGENSIRIVGNSSIGKITIARVDGKVRVFSEDGSEIGEVTVDGSDDVILEGDVENVTVIAADITVTAMNAQIKTAVVEGENSRIVVQENASIDYVTVNGGGAEISGKGKVAAVSANADNVIVSTPGTKVTAAEGVSGVKAGTITVEQSNTETVPDGSTGSGGRRGSSNPSGPSDGATGAEFFTYEISGSAIVITGYDRAGGLNVVIPSSIEGYTVAHIGDNAFWGSGGIKGKGGDGEPGGDPLTSVTIPDTVQTIGRYAFRGNQLTEITIPGSVTSIGDYAFRESNLRTVVILDGVKTIGEGAFAENQITELTLPGSATSIGNEAFESNALTEVIIPSGVEAIGVYAFARNHISELSLPDSVTSIGDRAFIGNKLTEVTIPFGVEFIGASAFDFCDELTSFTVDPANSNYSSEDGVLFNKDKTTLIRFPAAHVQTDYVVPEGVASIGDSAFQLCMALVSVSIPDSVTSVGSYAFAYSPELVTVTGGDFITGMGINTFDECTKLKNITISTLVTSIGDYMFNSCRSLESVTIPHGVTSIGYRAFGDCTSLGAITIPAEVDNMGSYAFGGCSSLDSVTIQEGVRNIGENAFWRCTGLTEITIPDSVENIGRYAFQNCTNLETVTISNQVTSIGMFTFGGCTKLNKITIPDGVSTLENYAFYNCPNLTRIVIHSGVTGIGGDAIHDSARTVSFKSAYGLTESGGDAGTYEYSDGAWELWGK